MAAAVTSMQSRRAAAAEVAQQKKAKRMEKEKEKEKEKNGSHGAENGAAEELEGGGKVRVAGLKRDREQEKHTSIGTKKQTQPSAAIDITRVGSILQEAAIAQAQLLNNQNSSTYKNLFHSSASSSRVPKAEDLWVQKRKQM